MIYSLKPLSLIFKVGTKMCFCSIFKASFKNKMQYGFMDAYVYSIDKMKAIWFLWTHASISCLPSPTRRQKSLLVQKQC